jgi:hypothetical protein
MASIQFSASTIISVKEQFNINLLADYPFLGCNWGEFLPVGDGNKAGSLQNGNGFSPLLLTEKVKATMAKDLLYRGENELTPKNIAIASCLCMGIDTENIAKYPFVDFAYCENECTGDTDFHSISNSTWYELHETETDVSIVRRFSGNRANSLVGGSRDYNITTLVGQWCKKTGNRTDEKFISAQKRQNWVNHVASLVAQGLSEKEAVAAIKSGLSGKWTAEVLPLYVQRREQCQISLDGFKELSEARSNKHIEKIVNSWGISREFISSHPRTTAYARWVYEVASSETSYKNVAAKNTPFSDFFKSV